MASGWFNLGSFFSSNNSKDEKSKGNKEEKKTKKVVKKNFSTNKNTLPPSYKLVGNFLVDGFKFKSPAYKVYFLTHFHADHYNNLTKTFSFGKIYCSQITANLAVEKLGVDPNVFQIVEGKPNKSFSIFISSKKTNNKKYVWKSWESVQYRGRIPTFSDRCKPLSRSSFVPFSERWQKRFAHGRL